MVFDLIGLTPQWIVATRKRVNATTGVPTQNQMYACTHTHGGPATGVLLSSNGVNANYMESLARQAESAAQETLNNRVPAELRLSEGSSNAGGNRRSAEMNPSGPHDGDIDQIDQTVTVAQVHEIDGPPLVTIVNYGCHPTSITDCVYTADYPGILRTSIEEKTGAPCIYINGAGGDVNLRFTNPHQRGLAVARTHGVALAHEALRALGAGCRSTTTKVAASCKTASLIYADRISPQEARRIRADGQRMLTTVRTLGERRRAQEMMIGYADVVLATYQNRQWAPHLPVQIQTIRIGDLAIIAMPVELFAADGRALRAASPAPTTMVAGWTNGCWGYMPTRAAWTRGGYETIAFNWYGQPAAFHPRSGDNLRTAARATTEQVFTASRTNSC